MNANTQEQRVRFEELVHKKTQNYYMSNLVGSMIECSFGCTAETFRDILHPVSSSYRHKSITDQIQD